MSEQNQNQSPAIFEDRSMELMAQRDAAAVARATQEIQAALVIAQRNPRNEIRAEARIIEACRRKGLAAVAEYEYSRGGTRITGPTIDLLRAIANRWGNLLFGWAEVERQEGQSMVRCWAWDTQNNSRSERTFVVRHWRDVKGGGYALEDERDIYELCANMASRRVRACLEEIIDADIVEKAVEQCRKTLAEGEKLPIKDRAAKVVVAFSEFGVSQDMIEKKLGNNLDSVSENQLASLRRIHKALSDGVGRREDYFKPATEAPKFGNGNTDPDDAPPGAEVPGKAPAPEPPVTKAPADPLPETTSSPLRLLRDLARVSKIKEGALLQALADLGITDGSASSLEDLQITSPGSIQSVIKDWASLAARIKASGK